MLEVSRRLLAWHERSGVLSMSAILLKYHTRLVVILNSMLLLRYLLEKGLLSVELPGAQHIAAAGISELRHLMVQSLSSQPHLLP